jgi:hypothetical protein
MTFGLSSSVPLQTCRQPGADRQTAAVVDFGLIKLRGALAWSIWGIALSDQVRRRNPPHLRPSARSARLRD